MTAHIPYGYRIVDGKAVVDEVQAEQVRSFFEEYISGKALKVAAENVGLKIFHGSARCKPCGLSELCGKEGYKHIRDVGDKELFVIDVFHRASSSFLRTFGVSMSAACSLNLRSF